MMKCRAKHIYKDVEYTCQNMTHSLKEHMARYGPGEGDGHWRTFLVWDEEGSTKVIGRNPHENT